MPRSSKKSSRKPRRRDTDADSDFLRGMARGPWSLQWADEQEEEGRSFSGVDIYEASPEAPRWALRWARQLADKIILLNVDRVRTGSEVGIEGLYQEAVRAGFAKDRETFGFYLAMQSIGHGIAWDDDVPGGADLEIKLPHDEFYER
jgi:hypothetical protein